MPVTESALVSTESGRPNGYAANSNDTVSVIDTATDTVVDTFAVGPQTEANDHYLTVGPDATVCVVDETGRVLRVVTAS